MTSIIESINSLFSSAESEQKAKKRRASVPHDQNIPIELDSDVIDKLETIVNNTQLASSGRIQLINLHNLKTMLGETWSRLYHSIIEDLNREISSRTNNDDVYFARNEEEHLIVFMNKSHDQASLTCAKIVEVLTKKYLGYVDPCHLMVNEAISKPNGDLVFKSVSLGTLIERVLVHGNDDDNSKNELYNSTSGSIHEKNNLPFNVAYKPIWDVRNEAVSTYTATARSNVQSKTIKYGYHMLTYTNNPKAKIAMDHKIMQEALGSMDGLSEQKKRSIMSIPLSYETLFDAHRMKEFFDRCDAISPVLHPYISFLLVDFPIGAPSPKLNFITSNLLRYARVVTIQLNDIPSDVSKFKLCGIKCVSFKVNPTGGNEYQQQLEHISELCKKSRIYLSLEQVNNRDGFIAATAAGVDFISGDIIGEYMEAPKNMHRLSYEEILSQAKFAS